jgi:hypothetical protein
MLGKVIEISTWDTMGWDGELSDEWLRLLCELEVKAAKEQWRRSAL